MRIRALLVIGAWLVLVVLAAPWVIGLNDVKSNREIDFLPETAQSTAVKNIEEQLPGGTENVFLVVYVRQGGLTPEDRAVAERQRATLVEKYGPAMPILASDDGAALQYTLSVPADRGNPADYIADLRAQLADRPDGASVQVTGPGALSADFRNAFAGVDVQLLVATTLVVMVILLLTYRSPVLWLVPLLAVGASYAVSLGVVYALVKIFDITVNDQNASILLVLVFGVGTDYALLLVARYREELHRETDVAAAMMTALRRAAPAIAASAATVVFALLCLLAADMNNMAAMGPVAAAGITCTLAAMLTFFPALLILLGRRVFWPWIPRAGTERVTGSTVWHRVGDLVARHRVAATVGALVVLGALAAGLFGRTDALDPADRFVDTPESVTAQSLVAQHFPQHAGVPMTIATPSETRDRVLDAVRSDRGVAMVAPGRSGAEFSEIIAVPADPPGSAGERATIQRLRASLPTVAEGAVVGGPSAATLDSEAASRRDERVVIPLVLAVVTLILGLLLRSILAPIALVLTVVASFGSAIGASVWIFEHLFGFRGLEPAFLLMTFLFLVALGVDYNIFLMTRAREEARRFGTRPGVLRSLAVTGGVITSAGVALAATFAVLTTTPLVGLVQVGFAVAFGVLLDTLLVRTVLVPALTLLAGDWTWWPSRLPAPTAGSADEVPETTPAKA